MDFLLGSSVSIGMLTSTAKAVNDLVPVKIVFVTSERYNGNLGGLAGADARCQERAKAAGLSGTFKAWLSDRTTSVSQRFDRDFDYAAFFRTDGVMVANDWSDLTDGSLLGAIDRDEFGNTVGANFAWTNTDTGGTQEGWTETVIGGELPLLLAFLELALYHQRILGGHWGKRWFATTDIIFTVSSSEPDEFLSSPRWLEWYTGLKHNPVVDFVDEW
ncbi:hypothetical protein THAOC_24620, partial [Thalassiosira oceanica]